MAEVVVIAERFAEVAAKHGPLRLERRRNLQVFATFDVLALADLEQAASEPRIGKAAVDGDRLIKGLERRGVAILRCQDKSLESKTGCIARGKFEAPGQIHLCLVGVTETKFEFGK